MAIHEIARAKNENIKIWKFIQVALRPIVDAIRG